MEKTSDLALVAYEYGPFLFAILFVTTLTVVAQKAYANCDKPDQIKTFRRYFYVSFYFGIILVSVCVVWWIYDQAFPHKYVYTIHINGAPNLAAFVSHEACMRQENVDAGDGRTFRNISFVFVRDKRILPGQKVTIEQWPPQSAGIGPIPQPKHINLPISGNDENCNLGDDGLFDCSQ